MKTITLIIIIAAIAAIYGFRSRWQKPAHPISQEPMEFYQLQINEFKGL
jgi:hypothetical protein